MVQSCSADSLSLKYLRSSAVRLDDKCLFSCVCSEFVFMTFWLQPQWTSSSKWGARISRHPKLDLLSSWTWFRTRWIHPLIANVAAYDWSWIKFRMNDKSSLGWRNMREPRLEEGVLVNQIMFGLYQHIHPTGLRMNLIGNLSSCKSLPFTLQKASFCKTKGGLL